MLAARFGIHEDEANGSACMRSAAALGLQQSPLSTGDVVSDYAVNAATMCRAHC